MDEKDLKELNTAVAELRKAVDENTGQNTEKIEKLHGVIDKFEVKHQEMLVEQKNLENSNRELEGKLDTLDKTLSKRTEKKGSVDYKESVEYKALAKFCAKGEGSLDAEEVKALRTDDQASGGFLVPEQLAGIILKQIEEISPVRAFARKWNISGKSIDIPVRKGIPSAPYEGETETGDESASSYKSEKLVAHRQQATVGVTLDLLNFAGFNMESEILSDARLAFAKTEGEKFIKGTGSKQPEGILTDASIEKVDTAASLVLTLDDVIKLSGKLKIGYNPIYGFNRDTLVSLRTEKDSNGNYLWQIGGTAQPMQINGYDYAIFQDMDSISAGAGSLPVLFGDLFAGYSIFDSVQMAVLRDPYTKKKDAIVEFNINRWNTGQVTLPEAIKLLKVKA